MKEDISDDEEDMVDEEGSEDCPVIPVSKEEKRRLRRPQQKTLIIKVMGRTVGFKYLERCMRALWQPKSTLDIVAIEIDYFLAKFASVDDYEYALYNGPQTVLDHYLTVRKWCHNFDSTQDVMEKILVWVKIPCLPIEYYDREFLMRLSAKIGNPMKIDTNTSEVSRGKFA